MKWFEGAIPEAITLSRNSKSIFLVYIEGADEQSKELTKSIDSPEVSNKLESGDFVAIKLKNGDTPASQFSQIYPVLVVPSLYFIGVDGSILSIVAGKKDATNLIKEIDENLQKHRQANSGTTSLSGSQPGSSETSSTDTGSSATPGQNIEESKPETADPNIATESSMSEHMEEAEQRTSEVNTAHPVASEISLAAKENTIQNVPDVSMTVEETENVSSDPPDTSSANLEERVEYAKKLICEKQAKKAQEEKEKEKEKEQERRKMGQEMQKAKAQRQEDELKQLAKDRQLERQLEKQARDRVRQQIAQDRADRAAQTEAEKMKAKEAREEKLRLQAEAEKKANEKTKNTRLQIRLPDGSSHVFAFDADDTLSSVRAHVQKHLTMRSFTFSQLIPRHQFTTEEEGQTLRQLELIPSAVLLVLPSQNAQTTVVAAAAAATPSNISGGFSSMFWTLLQPLFLIINFLKTFLFGPPSPPPVEQRQGEDGPASSAQSSSSTRAYRRPRPDTGIRREGKMMRLATADSDEDENTYNGNSTQQM